MKRKLCKYKGIDIDMFIKLKSSFIFYLLYLECEIGKYGNQCQSTCGACLHPSQCSHVDGTCLTGCASGYTGRLCKTSKQQKQGLLYILEKTYEVTTFTLAFL